MFQVVSANSTAVSKLFTPFMASTGLSRTPFCCYDLLQTKSINRHQLLAAFLRNLRINGHQLLAAFLRNLSPLIMSNGIQFNSWRKKMESSFLGFACCNCLIQIPSVIVYGV